MNWLFLLLDVLIPLLLIAFGLASKTIARGKINAWVGYRTARSTASREAWEFANLTAGKVLLTEGLAGFVSGLIFGVTAMVLCATEVQGTICVLLELVQVAALVAAVPWIERQLKDRFH